MNCAQVLLEGLKAMGSRRIYGVVGTSNWRLERPGEIRPVLEEALRADGPAVVDIIVDPDDMPPANIEAALRMSE